MPSSFVTSTILLLLLLLFTHLIWAEKCAWNNCPKWSTEPGTINVHMIAHTHDDMGWIKSADDYYTGARPSLVPVGVQYILNTVLDELAKDPARRFCYAEAGFLHRWMTDHGPAERELLRRLVTETGQLELIGGGWTQPDEACTHYVDLVDQYSLGLGLLNASFGQCGHPKVAWQIDPFGHSREHANLAALMGHQALFFSRTHYAELAQRAKQRELEMVWSGSDDLKTNILTGGFMRGTYSPPNGFCFDTLCGDEPIVDNPAFEGYNVDQMVDKFLKFVREEAATQRHGHVMMTMGGDFQYSNANQWFTQLDKLLRALNGRTTSTNVTAFYSTPGCYLAALSSAAQLHLPTKADGDFFPYATSNHSYWTGYFVSKPALKGLIRRSSALLQLTRGLAVAAGHHQQQQSSHHPPSMSLEPLEQALALSTHHDAVTGTSKENVTRDYTRRLLTAWDGAESSLNASFWRLARKSLSAHSSSNSAFVAVPPLHFCRLTQNRTECPFTRETANFSLVLFNGQSRPLDAQLVRVPIYNNKHHGNVGNSIRVLDGQGRTVPSTLVKTFLGGPQQQLASAEPAPYELLFRASQVPALGFATFFVISTPKIVASAKRGGGNGRKWKSEFWHKNLPKLLRVLGEGNRRRWANSADNDNGNGTEISNKFFRLRFGPDGLLATVQDLRLNRTFRLRQQFHFYRGMSKGPNGTEQASGAYIFRPNGTEAQNFTGPVQLETVNTSLVQEVRQVVAPWLSQVIRLVPDKPLVEFEWLIGPLPKNKSALESTEVVSRYTVDGMHTEGAFWTDANGRQMVQRRRADKAKFYEGTEPVAANYYPVNSRILVQDQQLHLRMSVLTDRTQGGSSLRDGQIELMLHRRCFWDDGWGVDEALDEPGEDGRGLIVRGRHWLLLGPPNSSEHRPLALELFHTGPAQTMAFAPLDFVAGNVSLYATMFHTEFSALSSSSKLPPNVQLLTLRPLDEQHVLLRLEHFYQETDNIPHPVDADPVQVDIQNLFRSFSVVSAEELALAADRPVSSAGPRSGFAGLVIELRPMEIRTFRVQIARAVCC